MWFISQKIVYPEMSPDNILSSYLEQAVIKHNFKILLEFSRFVYMQYSKVKPPNVCLIYLDDQYLNLFYELKDMIVTDEEE